MQEHLILANAIADRRAFTLTEATGYTESLSDNGQALWSLISEWYEQDPEAETVNTYMLEERIRQAHPGHVELLTGIVKDCEGRESPGNFATVLLEGRRQVLRESMIMALADRKDGDFHDLTVEFQEVDELEHGDDVLVGTAVHELVHAIADGECIPLLVKLNPAIRGGLLRGQHILIFGRPEIGKSLLALNCLAGAAQAGYRVGFWENEDPIIVTQLRTAQAITGATEDELRDPSPALLKQLDKAGWDDRIFFKDSPGGTLAEIKAWVEYHKLDFLVINQLANLNAKHQDNRTLELGALARGARAIAKECNCAVMSVHQAGESADGRRVLRIVDLDFSKTALQAAVDVLAGWGADDDLYNKGQRMLTLSKNKRGGGHERLLFNIDLKRGTVE